MSDVAPVVRRATCSCGQLAVTCSGEPLRVSVCHCYGCQRRTGSVYGVGARFASEQVVTEGASTVYQRVGDSGGVATFHFCPTCGTTVHWSADRLPGVVLVAVGAFADATFPAPVVSIYEERRHSWSLPTNELEHLD